MEKYEYDGDQAGNKTADAKGIDESLSSGEVTINFTETSNISVSMLTLLHLIYMDKTGKGIMTPSEKCMSELYYDYMSSLYFFATGPDGFSIKVYGKLTGLFPINNPLTSLIPSKRGTATDASVSITYHYNHAEIMNPEIIYDFNYTIDSMKAITGSSKIENDVGCLNSKLLAWKQNNFYINTDNLDKGRNSAYGRLMPESKDGSGKESFSNGIFYPAPQNQWSGHPYIWEGKLVYRSI
jgi:hypothetical protein